MNRWLALALVAIAAGLALCGCGGDSSASSTASAELPPVGGPAAVHTVELRRGPLMVNASGFAVYTFSKDRGGKSACYGKCAEAWRPLLSAGTPKAGGHVAAADLGTTERADQTTQATYDGHPLYELAGNDRVDTPVDDGATAFGGQWHAVFVPKG